MRIDLTSLTVSVLLMFLVSSVYAGENPQDIFESKREHCSDSDGVTFSSCN